MGLTDVDPLGTRDSAVSDCQRQAVQPRTCSRSYCVPKSLLSGSSIPSIACKGKCESGGPRLTFGTTCELIGGAPLRQAGLAHNKAPLLGCKRAQATNLVYKNIALAPESCPSSLFLFPSKCRGFTCISEDSSEITFLLVENYIPDRSQLA